MAKTKAANSTVTPGKKAMARAAPKAAPDEIPRIYGETKGFLKIAWREAPETERAAPISNAMISLGSLILKTTTS